MAAETTERERIADEIAGSCLAIRARTVDRRVRRHFNRKLRPHGLRVSQLSLLVAICRRQPIQPVALSRVLGLEKSTLSRVLSRMEDRSWIEERNRDGRGYDVCLAPAGQRLLEDVAEDWHEAQSEIRELLDEELADALTAVSPVRQTGTAPDESSS